MRQRSGYICRWLCIGLLAHTALGLHQHLLQASEQGDDRSNEQPPAKPPVQTKIPRILHYIFLSGFDAYIAETQRPRAKMFRWHYDSCLKVHKNWEIKFWTQEMAEDLIRQHFNWFMPIWETYDMEVKRADAIRAFILSHYGGLYLDLDNECYRPAEEAFKDYDIVLQGTGFEGVNNGMMASVPGHPLWTRLMKTLEERYKGSDTDAWKNSPIYMTGPAVLTYTVQQYLKLTVPVSGFLGTTYSVDNTTVKIYSIGEFFVPCWGVDLVCMKRYEKELAAGTWDMTDIVGRHWFAGSWNKPWLLNADGRPKDRSLLQRGIEGSAPVLGGHGVGGGDSRDSDRYRRSLLRQARALPP